MWRRRTSAVSKWACTLVSVALIAVWAGSMWWGLEWVRRSPAGDFNVSVYLGGASLRWVSSSADATLSTSGGAAFQVRRLPAWMRRDDLWYPSFVGVPGKSLLVIPLWFPLLLAIAPASLQWWREIKRGRAARRGCHACGYDRRGLAADAKCPECGTVPAPGWVRCGGG